jgi:phytoene dehydrogenase-like protein
MRYDALVIGAGMSGLAAGIRLATAGKRVAILERHTLWGGLNSYFKRGGRRYDTGLHALTNYAARGAPGAPLTRILRQLRIPHEALKLRPQARSETVFRIGGGLVRLEYANDLEVMRDSVRRLFPAEIGGFERLLAALPGYGSGTEVDSPRDREPARAKVREHVRDPLLAEMLLVAPFFYGCASEHDLAWSDFGILFRSIHLEGMAYPAGGIKTLLDLLVERFRAEGGELRMRCGVARIVCEDGIARGVVLEDGGELEAEQIYSSAGLVETRGLCGTGSSAEDERDTGRLGFVETCSVLSRRPSELGYRATITFFNDGERFRYSRPEGLIDVASGVITSPDNYLWAEGERPANEGTLRVTVLANHERWTGLAEDEYAREKERAVRALLDAAAPFAFDPRPHTVARDAFTPRTVERYTAHRGGAIYGSPSKRRDGSSGIANLHLIGTDQGLVGIVGALLSGIGIVHRTQSAGSASR